jgi:hypothetical protein
MAIADDFSVAANGDIRYTGSGTNYTVIALHRWLGDLMDDAAASGNDILDITDATASERSTDNIITLKYPYNIDWVAAQHLYDGSIKQSRTSSNLGEDRWDGVLVFANAGMYLNIIQNGNVVSPNFWTTGLNADATNGISHRFMLKVRDNGTDIDGRKLIGQTREFGYTYSEFKINGTSPGNNVMALTYASDLNNATGASTIKGYTTITNTTEGYNGIDVDNNSTDEYYYSEWNRATYSINTFYERMKWLTRRATEEDYNTADTGTSYAVGNGTITAQGQSFSVGVVACYLTRGRVKLKKTGSPTGNATLKLYAHTGTFGSSGTPTGSALATSDTLDVSKLTTSYAEHELGFSTQYKMSASTNYFLVIDYSGGDASNYIQIEGAASGTHAGNEASYSGSWTAAGSADLYFKAFTSPEVYEMSGELFRGITHELDMTTPRSGTFQAVEDVSWTGGTGKLLAIDSTTASTKMWIQLMTGSAPSTGTLITGTSSSATGTTTGSATERTLSYPFCGASTGSALIGSYGFGVEATDLSASDKVFDLTNTLRQAPNYVTFTVGGLESGEDRVLVGPADGSALDEDQFTTDATYSGAAVTSIQVSPAIPSDTPSSGTIRVECDSGIYKRIAYSSYSGDTFTITSTDFSSDNATAGNNCYISYIDELASAATASFTSVYSSDRSLFIRVRDGGTAGDNEPIKTFETTGTLGSAGGSATAIRTADV